MTCALPPVDQSTTQLGWWDGLFLQDRPRRAGWHLGLDFMADAGSPALVPYDGRVIQKGHKGYGDVLPGSLFQDAFGHYVAIEHVVGGRTLVGVYANLDGASPLAVGATVSTGDLLGRVGRSGLHPSSPPRLFMKVMRPRSPSYGETTTDYGRPQLPGMDPVRDFFMPLGVERTGGDRNGPRPGLENFETTPGWGGTLVLRDSCGALSVALLSPSTQQPKYRRFGSTQLSSRAAYVPALYEGGSSGSSGGLLLLAGVALAGGAWMLMRKTAPKPPPWWVRRRRWK